MSRLPTLRDVAEVHQGIQFSRSLDEENRPLLISETRKPGFRPGLDVVPGRLDEPFVLRNRVWLNVSADVMRHKAYLLPWAKPKVVLNAATVSRGPWRLLPLPDSSGLVCYQRFHGAWPTGDWSIEALAAVLAGPVANAYVWDHEGKRDNRIMTVERIPMPVLGTPDLQRLTGYVQEYMATRRQLDEPMAPPSVEGHLRLCLQQIDALVIEGYDLPPRVERKLLDQFSGYPRPVPFDFTGFFPRDFLPCIPYHEYVSPSFQRASVTETLKRLVTIRDEAVHDAMEHLRRLDEEDS